MRGTIPDLPSPHPLGALLPSVYHADDFAQRFTAGLDDVLAPVLCTLDSLPAYFAAATAPVDFLDYLSHWVGVEFEPDWTVQRRRDVLRRAIAVHQRRGTVRGVEEAVGLVVGAPVEVIESGGARWSRTPNSELPGDDVPRMIVRIDAEDLSALERRRIDGLVEVVKPAHVPHVIEVGPVHRGRHSGAGPPPEEPGEPADRPASDSGGDVPAEASVIGAAGQPGQQGGATGLPSGDDDGDTPAASSGTTE